VFERFFLGGIFTVRGFQLNQLGPRVGLPRDYVPPDGGIVPETGEAVGGNMQLYFNLEFEFPIVQQVGIRGVLFLDGGNAWNLDRYLCEAPAAPVGDPSADPCRVDLFDLRTSWGFGVRWISPLGPLRFEWGIPFLRRRWESEIDFQFTIGNFF
jgi:outer membrane protein insertion porin family